MRMHEPFACTFDVYGVCAEELGGGSLFEHDTMSIIQKSTIEWRVDDLSDGHLAVFT